MSTIKKRDFNSVAKLFLALSIFLLAKSILTYIAEYNVVSMLGFAAHQTQLIILIAINALMIGAACIIYAKKRWGLILFLLLALAKMFVIVPSGINACAFNLGRYLASFIPETGLFAIAMCFRKNGISGWIAFFASEKYIDEKMTDERKTQNDAQCEMASNILAEPSGDSILEDLEEISENRETVLKASVEIDSSKVEDATEVSNQNINIHETCANTKSNTIQLIAIAIIMFVLGGIIMYVIFGESSNCGNSSDISSNEYVSGESDILDPVYENILTNDSDGNFLCQDGGNYLWRNYNSFLENKTKYLGKEIYAITDTVHRDSDIDYQSTYAYFTQIKSLKFIIAIDGYEGVSERDINWWKSKEKRLYQKYPQSEVYASSRDGSWSIIQGTELISLYDEIIAKEPGSIVVKVEKCNFSIQRRFFSALELGKVVNKRLIASAFKVKSSKINNYQRPIGVAYIFETLTAFSGVVWSAVEIRCIEDKISTIIMKHSADKSNYDIYLSLSRLLKDKYGDPIKEYEDLLWQDGETAVKLTYDKIGQSTNAITYTVTLEYSDINLINQGQKTIINEL